MQWCCQLLQSLAKSRAEFYFVQRFAQQKHCETTHVTLCNSPATCLAMALRDELLRKLHSVTGPFIMTEMASFEVSFLERSERWQLQISGACYTMSIFCCANGIHVTSLGQ